MQLIIIHLEVKHLFEDNDQLERSNGGCVQPLSEKQFVIGDIIWLHFELQSAESDLFYPLLYAFLVMISSAGLP